MPRPPALPARIASPPGTAPAATPFPGGRSSKPPGPKSPSIAWEMPGPPRRGEDSKGAEGGEADVLDRHQWLAVRLLEGPLLPPQPAEEPVARLLRRALRDRGGQQLLLSASVGSCLRTVAGRNAGRLPDRAEGQPLPHAHPQAQGRRGVGGAVLVASEAARLEARAAALPAAADLRRGRGATGLVPRTPSEGSSIGVRVPASLLGDRGHALAPRRRWSGARSCRPSGGTRPAPRRRRVELRPLPSGTAGRRGLSTREAPALGRPAYGAPRGGRLRLLQQRPG